MFLALFPYLVIAGLCVLLWRSRASAELGAQGLAISSRSGSPAEPDPTQRPWEDEARVLQTTLSSIDQGIYMIGEDGRIGTYNQRLCELLDLPESFMASRPTLHEMTRFQADRGDFGHDASRVGESAREHVLSLGASEPPQSYVRATHDGRMLEVRTKRLSAAAMVRTFTDVTAMREASSATREGIQRLNLALEGARLALWDYNLVTHRVYLSASWSEMLGGPRQAQTVDIGDVLGVIPTDDRPAVTEATTRLLKGEVEEFMLEHQLCRLDGRMLRVVTQGRVTERAPDGRALRAIGTSRDVTAEREAESALREGEARWKLALESAGDGMWDWDMRTGVQTYSRRCMEMYGYTEGERFDQFESFENMKHPQDLEATRLLMSEYLAGKTPRFASEHRIRCKDGSWKWILSRGAVISRDLQGLPLRMIGTHTDITERKNTETLVWQQANFDALTGLPNRRMLRDRLAQGMLASRRDGSSLAVLFLDLDHFKEINDTLGHDRGDQLLIEAARRIRACVRETDTVGRMGGDEFTVLLSELRETQRVELIAQSVLESLSQAFELGGEQCFISASIGVAIFPDDASDIEELFKHADQALYVAKEAGRNCFRYFTAALQAAAQMRMRLALDLRRALPERQLQVVYQPVVDLASGLIYKAEALVRWEHPEHGLVGPYTFIPIAESTGLIVGIGDWVFEQAALQAQLWRARHDPRFQISVNRSAVQFHQAGDSQRRWIERLATLNLPGNSIVVEITESLLMDKRSDVKGQLLELRQAGIAVALDDFGTGYSSLSYLQNYDLDYLKIDQSFVRNLRPGSKDSELCKAIIVMAQALGLKVIAEGVETVEQRDWLRAQGCDYGQGYLFAKPMPAEELDALLASMTRSPF